MIIFSQGSYALEGTFFTNFDKHSYLDTNANVLEVN
jgi:hypothetical protein